MSHTLRYSIYAKSNFNAKISNLMTQFFVGRLNDAHTDFDTPTPP